MVGPGFALADESEYRDGAVGLGEVGHGGGGDVVFSRPYIGATGGSLERAGDFGMLAPAGVRPPPERGAGGAG